MDFKNIIADVKDVDTKNRIVKLYYSVFDVKDSDGDIIKKGALSKSQSDWGPGGQNRIWHLDNHIPSARVGKPIEMGEDDFGAWAVTKVSDTRDGKDIMVLYDDGAITEHSFGFEVMNSEKSDDGTPILTNLRQYEYSSVTWGANMFTETIGVKSEHLDRLHDEHTKWTNILQKSRLSDEYCCLLEARIKYLSMTLDALEYHREPGKGIWEEKAADLSSVFGSFTEKIELKTILK